MHCVISVIIHCPLLSKINWSYQSSSLLTDCYCVSFMLPGLRSCQLKLWLFHWIRFRGKQADALHHKAKTHTQLVSQVSRPSCLNWLRDEMCHSADDWLSVQLSFGFAVINQISMAPCQGVNQAAHVNVNVGSVAKTCWLKSGPSSAGLMWGSIPGHSSAVTKWSFKPESSCVCWLLTVVFELWLTGHRSNPRLSPSVTLYCVG